METITLFEEYRLIERSESEVNAAWKGAHLLLFFLAFVFGSFCTFCFHMLMYLFDEKCVLFPKLLSLTSLRQNIIYEFIPRDKELADMLPVDFLSTQWVDKSACYLPTYVPLVSGIFGLVWTTMFLMCSTGSRTLTGLQRPWRVLLPVFVFSLAMGGLCLYATIVTHDGLQQLCIKLGEITGSSTCTYTVNVATLAYERRIRGVYQATRIIILSAWLHTSCWLLSALLTLARVLLVVDFQLIKVRVQLKGNIDKMLERNEEQIRSVSPASWINNEFSPKSDLSSRSHSSIKVHFKKKEQESRFVDTSSLNYNVEVLKRDEGEILFKSTVPQSTSDPSLVVGEKNKIDRLLAYNSVPKDKQFIVKMVYDLIDTLDSPDVSKTSVSLASTDKDVSESKPITRQYGQQLITSKTKKQISKPDIEPEETEQLVLDIKSNLENKTSKKFTDLQSGASTSTKASDFESDMNITTEIKYLLSDDVESREDTTLKRELSTSNIYEQIHGDEKSKFKKSNLNKLTKNKSVQTKETAKTGSSPKVQITESRASVFADVISSAEFVNKQQKQKEKPKKEKED